MGDRRPSPLPKPHLALLASWALSHDERRAFVSAYRRRAGLALEMRQLADDIVARAEALTNQERRLSADGRGLWGEAEVAIFERWLHHLLRCRNHHVADLNRRHQAMSDCVEDLARSGRFRSAERLAEVLMLDRELPDGTANER